MYAQQINGQWTELRGNIVFSPTVYQTAESLSDEQRARFDVYPIVDAPRAEISSTQKYGDPVLSLVNNAVHRSWPVVDKTPEEIYADQLALQQSIVSQTQERLDSFARTRGYDGILSACTYATSTVPKFRDEGQYCVNMRDATWASLYTLMAEVHAGTRSVPTGYEDVGPLLPALVWPA